MRKFRVNHHYKLSDEIVNLNVSGKIKINIGEGQ